MSRRKKSLEKEFYKRIENHKTYIILEALSRPENQYLYRECKLLRDYKDTDVYFIKGYEKEFSYEQCRACLVETDLLERAKRGEDIYDEVYEICWDLVKQYQDEDTPEQYGLNK